MRATSVTCGGLLSKSISASELSLFDVTSFTHSSCRHGVFQNNRKTALSQNLHPRFCDLQIKQMNCIKIWSFRVLVGHHLGCACEMLSAMNYPMNASLRSGMLVLLCDHWCLVRSVLLERMTCDCLKILCDGCELSIQTETSCF